jgi:hypothetical protein
MNIRSKIEAVRRGLVKRFWQRTIALNDGRLAIRINEPHIGFFAHLNVVVRILSLAENIGAKPEIECISANYRQEGMTENWLSYFFEYNQPQGKSAFLCNEIRTHRDIGYDHDENISLEKANSLFFDYFTIKTDVLDIVNVFCRDMQIDARSLAVHYRGTDKKQEAPRTNYNHIIKIIRQQFETSSHTNIFVASDEQNFVLEMIDQFGREIVKFHAFERSSNDTPMHLAGSAIGGYDRGLSALADCLTLARCGAIVRTASLLSSWASVFNPGLPVTLASKSYEDRSWWPERLIAETAEIG